MPSCSKVRCAGRCDCSMILMISSFSDAGYAHVLAIDERHAGNPLNGILRYTVHPVHVAATRRIGPPPSASVSPPVRVADVPGLGTFGGHSFLTSRWDYRLAESWRWVVHTLEGGGRTYRLLIGYDLAKSQFQSWLGLADGNDSALVARLEFHDSHGGWHCHWKAGDTDSVVRGIVRGGPVDRMRKCDGAARQFNDNDATALAFRVFKVVSSVPAGSLV